ncbi:MAG: serine/threonine-protein kinase [Planctomycetes bacterium]|nr:serine/threonine-protein kinase [Planctomycetota bacterium]
MLDGGELKRSLADPKHGGFAGQTFGKYEILATISKGGVGAVFRARHRELGQLVALKLLLREDPSPEALGRFRREGQVLAKIKHDNVVGISDLGEDNGVPYLVMELIDGRDLHKTVRAPGADLPDFEWTVGVMTCVARALAHCHEQGVIHRDVKPHNIIVEHGTGRAVLTDFGLVKRDPALGGADGASQLSVAGAVMGTPSFMAPEQFEPDGPFGAVGPRTDVWGFGATLFFLLTGRPPFSSTNIVDLYHQVTTLPVPSPGSLRPSVPVVLDDLVAACLKKNVAERPTMAELIPRLEALHGRLCRVSARRGLRHTLVMVLLLSGLLAVDVLWLHPQRGRRLARLMIGGAPDAARGDRGGPDGDESLAGLEARAAAGEAAAMLRLGLMHKDGKGASRDLEVARRWFRRAAEAGDASAAFWAAVCADRGVGGSVDPAEAARWFEAAARQGHVKAMFWLGTYLADGKAGPAQPASARDWFVKARDGGDDELKARAQDELTRLRRAHPELAE